jgi:ferredoxin
MAKSVKCVRCSIYYEVCPTYILRVIGVGLWKDEQHSTLCTKEEIYISDKSKVLYEGHNGNSELHAEPE